MLKKRAKYVAVSAAGVLGLSLGLAACGGTTEAPATEAPVVAETEAPVVVETEAPVVEAPADENELPLLLPGYLLYGGGGPG